MQPYIEGLNFQPWVPKAYEDGTDIYRKLLILGESHYNNDDDNDDKKDENDDLPNHFTSAIVQGFIDKKYDHLKFFRNLGLAFNRVNRYTLWEKVAFANLIQVSLTDPNQQPTLEQISTITPAFWLLLENLKPNKIIICSQRMWTNWMTDIDNDNRSKLLQNPLNVNGKHSTIWHYNFGSVDCRAIGINHPSRAFSYDDWNPIIMEFLNL